MNGLLDTNIYRLALEKSPCVVSQMGPWKRSCLDRNLQASQDFPRDPKRSSTAPECEFHSPIELNCEGFERSY